MALARSEELVVEELDDGLLVYDLRTDRAHSLSAPAACVWRHCDGRTRLDGLAAATGLDPDVVARALDELHACDLLAAGGTTRREATIKVAKIGGAAVTAPLIASLTVPATVAAAT